MNSSERRAAIVREAIRLFAERGFRGTTTRQLAAAVGVTEPVLYEHFRTKRELYEAIIELKACQGPERLAALLDAHLASGDDRGFFEGLAALMLEFYESNPDFVRLAMFSALESHEMGGMFSQRYREVILATIRNYLERRIRQGALRRVDPELAARAFAAMAAQFGLQLVLFPAVLPPVERKELARGMADIFLNGLACNGKASSKNRKR